MLSRPIRLIVNADDLGYTPGVNRATLELHRAGALSSATLMANGAAFEDALSYLPQTRNPTAPGELGVGCHVVLVDGAPVAPAAEIPTLTVPIAGPLRGAAKGTICEDTPLPLSIEAGFRPALSRFVADLVRGRISEADIEIEAMAQIRRLQARGLHVTHVDTHKHTHMFPRVLRPLLRAALQCGVHAIRNPFEPAWSIDATPRASLLRRSEVRMLALFRAEFLRLVERAGLYTTAGAIGVLATGTLDADTLACLLRAALDQAQAPGHDATWELVCHPGYHDAALAAQATRLLGARELERAAFMAEAPLMKRLSLLHFGQLTDEHRIRI